jgi:hypothetical protein
MQRCNSHTCCTRPRVTYCFYAAAAVAAPVLLLVRRVAAAAAAGARVAGGLPHYDCVEGCAGCSVFAEAMLQLLAAAVNLALSLAVKTKTRSAARTDDSEDSRCEGAKIRNHRMYEFQQAAALCIPSNHPCCPTAITKQQAGIETALQQARMQHYQHWQSTHQGRLRNR